MRTFFEERPRELSRIHEILALLWLVCRSVFRGLGLVFVLHDK